MDNSNKIILDLCGGTGSWSKPYKDAGYDVRVITLPEYDITNCFIANHHLSFPKLTGPDGERPSLRIDIHQIYGILAAPPCTEFSVAKGNRPRNFEGGLRVVEACFKIIWNVRIQGPLKFWALENPRGLLRQFLGIPLFTFEQWKFGALVYKPTDLWGYFNKPTPTVKIPPAELSASLGNGRHHKYMSDPKCPHEYINMHLDRAAIRAITPPGFAKAFYKANK